MSNEQLQIAKDITIYLINKATENSIDIENLSNYGEQASKLFITICEAVVNASNNKF